jgi:hypothetical protein
MDYRRAKGLCYNYVKKFQRGHRCKNLLSVYVISDDLELDEADCSETEPKISPHALNGVNTGSCMVMPVYVLGVCLIALVDLGSTHNFISNEAT